MATETGIYATVNSASAACRSEAASRLLEVRTAVATQRRRGKAQRGKGRDDSWPTEELPVVNSAASSSEATLLDFPAHRVSVPRVQGDH